MIPQGIKPSYFKPTHQHFDQNCFPGIAVQGWQCSYNGDEIVMQLNRCVNSSKPAIMIIIIVIIIFTTVTAIPIWAHYAVMTSVFQS